MREVFQVHAVVGWQAFLAHMGFSLLYQLVGYIPLGVPCLDREPAMVSSYCVGVLLLDGRDSEDS